MDSLTHLALGAVTGEVLLSNKIGKKSMMLGAIAQVFPDLDVVVGLWLSPIDAALAHRGFTHSIFFVVLGAVGFTISARSKFRPRIGSTTLFSFFLFQLSLHIGIDLFNAYGVALVAPLSNQRFSFNTLYVIDPFFTCWVVIASLALLVIRRTHTFRRSIAFLGLSLSGAYMCYAIANKIYVERTVEKSIGQQLNCRRYMTTPTPFNTWLWYIVIENERGYYTGYRSVFDGKASIQLTYFTRGDSLLEQVPLLSKLKQFSSGYYNGTIRGDTLVFNVMKFGQVSGWMNPGGPFVFELAVRPQEHDYGLLQRQRAKELNRESMQTLWQRIRGS